MIPYSWFLNAQTRIAPHVRKTPLLYDQKLDIFLKLENHQITGSFKVRGATNKVLTLEPWECERGLVTASAGNHGLGVAYAGKLVNAPVTVFVSKNAVKTKIDAIINMQANTQLIEGGYAEAEDAAIKFARKKNATWVSPYNDGQVISGQGTIALEVLKEQPNLSHAVWLVPVGGGGLISGIGATISGYIENVGINDAIKLTQLKIFGVQSQASAFMSTYFHTGSQIGCIELSSVADGLSGSVEEGSITFPLVRKYVTDFILVSEAEIIEAIKYAWNNYSEIIEGSAAVSLAAILTGKLSTRPVVVIISGGNIQPEFHEQIIY